MGPTLSSFRRVNYNVFRCSRVNSSLVQCTVVCLGKPRTENYGEKNYIIKEKQCPGTNTTTAAAAAAAVAAAAAQAPSGFQNWLDCRTFFLCFFYLKKKINEEKYEEKKLQIGGASWWRVSYPLGYPAQCVLPLIFIEQALQIPETTTIRTATTQITTITKPKTITTI